MIFRQIRASYIWNILIAIAFKGRSLQKYYSTNNFIRYIVYFQYRILYTEWRNSQNEIKNLDWFKDLSSAKLNQMALFSVFVLKADLVREKVHGSVRVQTLAKASWTSWWNWPINDIDWWIVTSYPISKYLHWNWVFLECYFHCKKIYKKKIKLF